MIINVGSTNKVKVNAVKEIISYYDFLRDASVKGVEVFSGVAEQPKSLEETIKGAMNRARNAYKNCDLSIGLESGVMPVPYTKTGYMDVTACAIYDGKEYHLGLSSAFEYPKELTRLLFEEGLTVNEATQKIGLSNEGDVGSRQGTIGILTKGRLERKEYTKQAITTALIHLENAHLW